MRHLDNSMFDMSQLIIMVTVTVAYVMMLIRAYNSAIQALDDE